MLAAVDSAPLYMYVKSLREREKPFPAYKYGSMGEMDAFPKSEVYCVEAMDIILYNFLPSLKRQIW